MDKLSILWADDEIDLLKPHVLFLRDKGFDVTTATNGHDALDLFQKQRFEIVFLDENMPGLSGLETLVRLKNINASVPVVMITKSEEEYIMEDAIGSKIADYLIKPVNPNQILLSIKKNLDTKRLVSEKTTSVYQQEFRNIGMTIHDKLDYKSWIDVYKKLIYWELELEKSKDEGMYEILTMQKDEANVQFSKFVEANYLSWLKQDDKAPVLSHTLFRKKILPVIESTEDPVFFLLIDNLRYDQWRMIAPILSEELRVVEEDAYFSILPTATQYARNAIFAGMMPSDIEKRFPKLWLNDDDEGGKNQHEEEFMADQLQRLRKPIKFSYTKVTNFDAGKAMVDNIANMFQNKFNIIVYNFVDMLSHARTDMQVIRELADDEAAYRSLTVSWFEHSPLLEAIRKMVAKNVKVVISTDHGTIRVKEPSKLIGDRNTNTNLRYKQGKNLNYEKRDVFEVKNPADAMLPRNNLSTAFVFAKQDKFFAYPNNYNHYVNFYKNTFQHGGISPEEMIIPIISLTNR
ncbi:MAG: PglZ domain-containing protein [Bacteroidetes bacterium]|nr:PglZ domain-containing protein [Bacteroidota bacterium]MBK9046107.1 PglZ domain-containing protein [Bacteroidota bacterium]MBK9424691.1 PglZ domain-containing protein [Bacteroidota bacterium]MBL0070768.1 PglZ domain-containing protein [Bacteroidota bacterium]